MSKPSEVVGGNFIADGVVNVMQAWELEFES
jgi:hypothetical protein